jgi:hypothetical protein
MKTWAALGLLMTLPVAAQAPNMVLIGQSAGGRQIFVDPTGLKTLPPLLGLRDFPVAQLSVEMRGPGTKGSIEQVRYSFNCKARSAVALQYQRTAAGKLSHNWRGADLAAKYEVIAPGTLVDMALSFACSGGKLPVRPKLTPADGSELKEDEVN